MKRMLQCVVTVTMIDLDDATLRPTGPPTQEQIVLTYTDLDTLRARVDRMEQGAKP